MPVRVEIPIRIRVDPLALLERQDDLEDALAAAVGRALKNSRDVVLAQRGGYVGVKVHPPEFLWYGDGLNSSTNQTQTDIEERVLTVISQAVRSAGIFDLARVSEQVQQPLLAEIAEQVDQERYTSGSHLYTLPSYEDGERTTLPVIKSPLLFPIYGYGLASRPKAPDSLQEAADAIGTATIAERALGIKSDDPVWGKLNRLWMVHLLQSLENAAKVGQLAALDRHVDLAGGGTNVRLRLAIDAVKIKLKGVKYGQIDSTFVERLAVLKDRKQNEEVIAYVAGVKEVQYESGIAKNIVVVSPPRSTGQPDYLTPLSPVQPSIIDPSKVAKQRAALEEYEKEQQKLFRILAWDKYLAYGLKRSALGTKLEKSWEQIENNLTDAHKAFDFFTGFQIGVPIGAVKDIYDQLKAVSELIVKVYLFQIELEKKVKTNPQKIWEDLIEFAYSIADKVISFLDAEKLGLSIGNAIAHEIDENFVKKNAFDQGKYLGEIAGMLIMEVALLFIGIEEISGAVKAIRTTAKALRETRFGLEVAEKMSATSKPLKAILEARGLRFGEKSALAELKEGKVAVEEATEAAKLSRTSGKLRKEPFKVENTATGETHEFKFFEDGKIRRCSEEPCSHLIDSFKTRSEKALKELAPDNPLRQKAEALNDEAIKIQEEYGNVVKEASALPEAEKEARLTDIEAKMRQRLDNTERGMAKVEAEVSLVQQRALLQRQISDTQGLRIQITKEIEELNQPAVKRLSPEELKARSKKPPHELSREEGKALENLKDQEKKIGEKLEKLRVERADIEVTPLAKARAYSFSNEAERTVYTRASGTDKLSGKQGLLDEHSRRLITEPSIDHIVPVDTIVNMKGWNKLPKETQRRILSRIDNLALMEKNLNSSKGIKRWADWDHGRQFYGDEVWNSMVAKERTLFDSIQKEILDSLP